MSSRDFYAKLVYARKIPGVGRLSYYILKVLGVEIPLAVEIGQGFYLVHGGFGVVIHPNTSIGNNVKIYPGVVLGRADIYKPVEASQFKGIVVEEGVILSPGAKILCREDVLCVAAGTVVGANSVLLESTRPNEIWAGIPARCVGTRDERTVRD
jgi:serine O-acetyltransferase